MYGEVHCFNCPKASAGSSPWPSVGRNIYIGLCSLLTLSKYELHNSVRASSSTTVARSLMSHVWGQKKVAPCESRNFWSAARHASSVGWPCPTTGTIMCAWCMGPTLHPGKGARPWIVFILSAIAHIITARERNFFFLLLGKVLKSQVCSSFKELLS